MPTMVRFIHSTPDKPGPWRRQARQACLACRRRKKRCKHLEGSRPRPTAPLQDRSPDETVRESVAGFGLNKQHTASECDVPSHAHSPAEERPSQLGRGGRPLDPEPSQGSDAHFVGDLNPESTFLADSPETAGGYTEADGIGVWVSRRAAVPGVAPCPRGDQISHARLSGLSPSDAIEGYLTIVPGDAHYKCLEEIYLRDIHSILPVIDLDILRGNSATIPHILSKQAICLAAAAHPDAKPFLTLGPLTTPLPYPAFSQQLISAMRAVLNAPIDKGRLQLIPAIIILSLNAYFSPDRHLSAELASLAVSHTQTVGLHHRSPPISHNPEHLERLFCCVWAMDRLNAAFHGRPVLMHERDFGRDLEGCFARQESCCRLFLECVMLLDGVIHLYRPTTRDSGGNWELPRFEDLVDKAGAFDVESRLLVTVELLYHAIVILSCRAPSATRSHAQVTPRETLSSLAITAIIAEFRDRLPYLTFVSYAASLALRTTYRELRGSSVPTVRARSFRQLRDSCNMLRRFEEMYRPASIMVELVNRFTREVDRVSGNPVRLEPATGAPGTSEHRDELSLRAGECDEMAGEQDARVNPVVGAVPTDDLYRLDVFESLNFDFDFDALDAAFGDYTYPCPSTDFT